MSLSSLIVQREVATIRQVEEALARQVLYGGDLVTNLLEVVQVPEAILAPLLAESLGMPAAPIGMLPPPSPQARALVPEETAVKRALVPLTVEGDRLIVAVSEPFGRDELEELSFALGVRVDERIAPSVRIREALARVYGLTLERRMARLVGRLAGVDPTGPNSLPPVNVPKASVPPLAAVLSLDLPRLNPPGTPELGSFRIPDSKPPPEFFRGDAVRSLAGRPVSVLPTLLRESKAPDPIASRRRGPITLERVTDELPTVNDREGLLHLFFDFARQFFEYSTIFVLHGDLAEGRDAFGPGAPRERVVAIGVPLDMPSVLRTVRDRRAPVCLYPDEAGLDAVLMSDLRRSVRFQLLVVPLVVRTRVVAFFVADDGTTGIDPSAQGEVAAVAALVGRAFERLIVRTKLQGFTGEIPASERRVDPRRVEPKRFRRDPAAREAGVHALEQIVAASQPPPPVTAVTAPPPAVGTLPAPAGAPASARPGALRPNALRPSVRAPADLPPPFVAVPLEPPPPADEPPGPLAHASSPPGRRAGHATIPGFPAPIVAPAAESDTEKVPPVAPSRPPSEAPRAPSSRPSDPARAPSYDASDDPIALAQAPLLPSSLSDLPPPPQAVAVRRPSGQPIPREEPDDDDIPASSTRFEDAGPISSTRFTSERLSSRPPPADLRQARLLREIDNLTAKFVPAEPVSQRGPTSTRDGQSIAVPPHRPPSSRTHESLPSVIVDVTAQVDLLVEAFIAHPLDEQQEAALLRLGQQAMPSIMKVFPGPITITRATLDDSWPRVTECGPILRLIAGQRRVALPFVLARTDDADTEARFWATYLLTELPYAEAIPSVVARLFDDSKRVRRAARLVAYVLGDFAGAALAAELDRIVRDPKAPAARRVVTIDALGEMRDPLVVPILLNTLGEDDEELSFAARRALVVVTRQDFGRDVRKWITWWNGASSRHRIEWLIDALGHDSPTLRRAAGVELKAITEEYFGYYDDLPKKDRDRAQQLYRDWWRRDGQARFRRS